MERDIEDPEMRVWIEEFLDQISEEGQAAIPVPSAPPDPEVIVGIKTLLENYENIVRAAIQYEDDDLCLLDPSYEALVQSKFKEEATYGALTEDAKDLGDRMADCENSISSLEIQYAETRDAHRLSYGYQFVVNQLRQDRAGLKIDELTDTITNKGMTIMPQSLMMINRIGYELTDEQSATPASSDKLDRIDTPTVLYLRRLKHEKIRTYHASIQGTSTRLMMKKELMIDLRSKYEARSKDITESRNRIADLVKKIVEKRDQILSSQAIEEEKSSRESYFTAVLRDLDLARAEYGIQRSSPEREEKKPTVIKKKKKKKITKKASKPVNVPKDEEIVLEAIGSLGGTDRAITTRQLVDYANDTYPNWQEGRNINKSDQAVKSLRSRLFKMAELIPGTQRYKLRPDYSTH